MNSFGVIFIWGLLYPQITQIKQIETLNPERQIILPPQTGQSTVRRRHMKIQRLLIALTIINLGLTLFLLTQLRRVEADNEKGSTPDGIAPVLRGRELEIVDEKGKVRASIKIQTGDPSYKWPDGKIGYPETVMLRLIDPNGRPEVKLGASVEGAGLGLIGQTDSTQLILKAEGSNSSVKLQDKEGKQQIIKP